MLFKGAFYSINEDIKSVILKTKNNSFFQANNKNYEILNKNIIVVSIDEKTLQKFGFPFSRSIYAPVIENLNNAGTEIIGFDLIFANENFSDIEGDNIFANSIHKAGNIVLGSAIIPNNKNNSGIIESPLQKFASGAITYGYFQPNVDPKTNIVTSFRPSAELYDLENKYKIFNHFAISVLKAYFSKIYNRNYISYEEQDNFFYYLRPDYPIPFYLTNKKDVLINFLPLPEVKENKISKFPTFSFYDIYEGNFDPDLFKNKIVLIGVTAKGIKDTFNTPYGIEYGVYVVANIINTILTKNYLIYFDENLEFILIFLLIILSVYFNLSRSSYVLIFSNLAITIIFLIIFPLIILVFTSYLLNYLFQLFLALIISLSVSNIVKYILENKDKVKLNVALSEYVSKDIADEILSNEGIINLDGQRKNLAIYFSDIEGFTSISEKMEAEDLVSFLREFLSNMSNIIMDEKGFINKYEGDAIMALWGTFLDYNDSSYRACITCIKQQEKLKELNIGWESRGIPKIKMRIGLHVGEAIIGNIGSKGRKMEFTALGDNINIASRLEGVNKFYGTYTCVSETVYKENKQFFEFRFLDKIRLVGKENSINIYELIGVKGEIDSIKLDIISKFEKAIKFYQSRNFLGAKEIFEELVLFDDGPSINYLGRCNNFLVNPPSINWDGVWDLESK